MTNILSPVTGLIFLGPPGSGKGTQAQLLAQIFGLSHISTGDILRQAITDKTQLGLEAQNFVEKGELVPDQLLLNLIHEALNGPQVSAGWILDGFPRTVVQARFLDELLKEFSSLSVFVINLEVPDQVLIERLLQRGRQDDTKEIIANRLTVYQQKTAPVLDYYRSQGQLHSVDGNRQLEDITSSLEDLISLDK